MNSARSGVSSCRRSEAVTCDFMHLGQDWRHDQRIGATSSLFAAAASSVVPEPSRFNQAEQHHAIVGLRLKVAFAQMKPSYGN